MARRLIECSPPEIIHRICRCFTVDTAKDFRLTCKTFAVVGTGYLTLGELHLLYKRDWFVKAGEICRRDAMRRVAKALFFEANRLQPFSTNEWKQKRLDRMGFDEIAHAYEELYGRMSLDRITELANQRLRSFRRTQRKEDKASLGVLQAQYNTHRHFYEGQKQVVIEGRI